MNLSSIWSVNRICFYLNKIFYEKTNDDLKFDIKSVNIFFTYLIHTTNFNFSKTIIITYLKSNVQNELRSNMVYKS